MYAAGVRRFVFDSADQIENLKHNAPQAKVFLRISTPNENSTFQLSHRLGHASDDAVQLIELAKKAGLEQEGLIFHVGSQCTNLENWRAAIRLCGELFNAYPSLKTINLGGGFPIDYQMGAPSPREIGLCINNAISEFFKFRPEILAEPGRFLVGNAALTCSSVLQVVNKPDCSRAMIDMSVFSGFIEMLESQGEISYKIETEHASDAMRPYQIIGPTCAGTDIVVERVNLPTLFVDHQNPQNCSKLFHLNTGAYTLDYISVGENHGFNGSRLPDVHFIKNGELMPQGNNNV